MQITSFSRAAFLVTLLMLPISACSTPKDVGPTALPVTRWDHRPEAPMWTKATLGALKREGAVLLSAVPQDVESFCPGYRAASADERGAFWTGLFSAIAQYESTWNPKAVGGGGRYLGLLQISPQTARSAGCDASALKDGTENLSCAVKIAARKANYSGVRGVVSDWGPMHDASKSRAISSWTRNQSYCQA